MNKAMDRLPSHFSVISLSAFLNIEVLLHDSNLRLLQLMQLADSALPIGSTAHSFGLETLVVEDYLTVEHLEAFLREYFEEAGTLESAACRMAYRLTSLTEHELSDCPFIRLRYPATSLLKKMRCNPVTVC